MGLRHRPPSKMFIQSTLLISLYLSASINAAPQMDRLGQPIADAYQTVENTVGRALNVVFSLSSWFQEYETAPYTNIGNIRPDALEERIYPARKWGCTKKSAMVTDSDPKNGMFWALFQYISWLPGVLDVEKMVLQECTL